MKKINKKGFSLVEVVIAMAVVSIVTITAISIVYSATDKNRAGTAESDAIYFAADVIECLEMTETEAEFIEALEFREEDKQVYKTSDIEMSPLLTHINSYFYEINSKWEANIEWKSKQIVDGNNLLYVTQHTITITITEKGTGRQLMDPIIYKKAER